MSGIFPNVEDGAVTVRDAEGNCLSPVEVVNAYCPPTTFQTSCVITALPDDCTARITPAQINAIVSEMLCFGVSLSPDATGAWDCDSTCNLATLFDEWVTANTPHGDGVTIEGDGSPSNLFRIIPAGVVAAICDDDDVRAALAACLISEEPNNLITLGVDGRLLANIVTSGGIIIGAGTADFPLSIDITEAQSQLGILPNPYRETLGTTNITILDRGAAVNFLASGDAIFDDAADLEDTFNTQIWASDNASVTLVPEAGQTINGLTSLIVPPGRRADVWSDGANLHAKITSDAQSIPGYISGMEIKTNSADPVNDIDILPGVAASDSTPFDTIQLTSILTKGIDAVWAPGNNAGGLDTGVVADGTYYVFAIENTSTGQADAIISASATTPVLPAGYDRKRLLGIIPRASGANGIPTVARTSYYEINSSTNFLKPPGLPDDALVLVELWAGGGGAALATAQGGGAGGGYKPLTLRGAQLAASTSVQIGAGGAVATAGGDTIFGAHGTAYGGGAGTASGGGSGGTPFAKGVNGGTTGGVGDSPDYWTGGGGGIPSSGQSQGGRSVYGGGGGSYTGQAGGISIFGGQGGGMGVGVAGQIPGGGGGRGGGVGARGRAIVRIIT